MSNDVCSENARSDEEIRLFPTANLDEMPKFKKPMIPNGVTIHYTAGSSARSSMNYLRSKNLGYHLLIDRDGTIWQMYQLNSTCSHAGKSVWNSQSCNEEHVSVAICNYGPLKYIQKTETFENAYGSEMDNAIWRDEEFWEPATEQQEEKLFTTLFWLCKILRIMPENICGHDEACLPKGRKIDPGGILAMGVPELRLALDAHYF